MSYSNQLQIKTPKANVTGHHLVSNYDYELPTVRQDPTNKSQYTLTSTPTSYELKTNLRVPKLGVMMVGWGGNNGSTLTASLIANKKKLTWLTRRGEQTANYYGSIFMASTTKIGVDETTGNDIFVPLNHVLPMCHPNDMVVGGWDINGANMAEAIERARVLEPGLICQVYDEMAKMRPLPSIYYKDFIAANQETRADNVLPGQSKLAHLETIRRDIRNFKHTNSLDTCIIMWTANTERFADLIDGVNDTEANLMKAISNDHAEISPSTMFAVAAILEKCPFINGSPQNTFVPGVLQMASYHDVYIGGDDFKSGQTKIKSVLVDFLVGAGIKPVSIASYNHLGNNDGMNLNSAKQFRSKEITKTNVVDDMVASNAILYDDATNERPDHCIVIKYIPAVGDSKRALDEYENEIFMGGRNTISLHNTCEDSLLAAPIIIDLVLLAELMTRIQVRRVSENKSSQFENFHSILSILSYMLKAPLSIDNKPVNSLFKQKNAIENFLRACVGLPPLNDLLFHKMLKQY